MRLAGGQEWFERMKTTADSPLGECMKAPARFAADGLGVSAAGCGDCNDDAQ
jgi:hypothetical protein